MIKKYLLDILFIVLVSALALWATQKPTLDLNLRPSIGDKGQLTDVKKEANEKVQEGIVRDVVALDALKKRNIFSPEGNYTKSVAVLKGPLSKGPPPENPYTLIGILQGEEKKAVFKEYTGSIITLTVGKQLGDGSIIRRIDELSVEVEKGKEKRELRIFNIKTPKPVTVKKP